MATGDGQIDVMRSFRAAIFWTIFALVLVVGSHALAQDVENMSKEELENEKLRQEILKLEREQGWWPFLQPVVPVLIATGGFVIAVRQHVGERARQRQADARQLAEDVRQREADREQRGVESRRRFDESFTRVVTNFGSDSPAVRASATVSLMTYLRPEYSEFHSQVFMFVLTNLKLDQDPEVRRLLGLAFEDAIRLELTSERKEERQRAKELARVQLPRVDLSGLDLSEADIAFATLKGADLRDANMFRVKGIEVNLERASLTGAKLSEARLRKARCAEAHFHDATMSSARLEEADLRGAELQRAKLQSTHFNDADIRGARFEDADLNDAYFTGATIDDAALRSVARARNWRKAHFDDAAKQKLKRLSSSESPRTVGA
jgi:uncharacterized protein YjbI with pentapeptide repeats